MNKVLVIDSSEEIRKIASLVLAEAGYAVNSVADDLEALERVKDLQPELILLDFSLPAMKDLHLLTKIRDASPKSHIGILISNPHDPDIEKARQLDGISLVVKGPGIISFLKTLQACVQRPGRTSAAQDDLHSQAKILVVDDEESIRTVLKRFLERKGYAVMTANNGPEAIKIVSTEKPVLVLLDVKMPGMDGLAVLEKIKALAPNIGVMMITGNTDEDIAKECMKRGAFDYIGKPLNFDYLENSVMAKIMILTS